VEVLRPSWVPHWVPTEVANSARHYSKAPIVEAILELRTTGFLTPIEALQEFSRTLPGWSDAQHEYIFNTKMELDPSGETSAESQRIGYAFRKSDQTRNIHLTTDRFAYAWLGGYTNWEELTAEALLAWKHLKQLTDVDSIVRIGARFVNRIVVPDPQIEISDYLRTTVHISPYLPQGLSGFFMQVSVPLDIEAGIGTTITSSLAPAPEGHSGLILDLDTYDQMASALSADDDEELMRRLMTLRMAKNYVFEASITDATRGLISDGANGP
jgi:uncharacterized protein (TIGR04255 family)